MYINNTKIGKNMAYRHNDTLHNHKVRANHFKKLALIFTGIVSVFVLVVTIDWVLGQLSNSNTLVSRENITSVQSANVSVYRSEYFQFQAPEDWVFVSSESTDSKFVYVKNKANLITNRFVVYINRPSRSQEADLKITRVLPVEQGELGSFINIGEVSNHCDDSWPENTVRTPTRIQHKSVSFVCSVDSEQYNVVVGEYNNDENILTTLRNGNQASFTIIYSDLTAYPIPGDIYNIVSSFSTL